MSIYILEQDLDYFYLQCLEDISEPYLRICGTPVRPIWNPRLRAEFIKEDPEFKPSKLKKADFYEMRHYPVFTEKSHKLLAKLIDHHGEMLPFQCEGEILYLFNTLTLCDVLDKKRSQFTYYSDGDIQSINKYCFLLNKLSKQTPIFKLSVKPCGDVFVTQDFVDAVAEYKLLGFEFKLVWSG